jgi:hypothetical protein
LKTFIHAKKVADTFETIGFALQNPFLATFLLKRGMCIFITRIYILIAQRPTENVMVCEKRPSWIPVARIE